MRASVLGALRVLLCNGSVFVPSRVSGAQSILPARRSPGSARRSRRNGCGRFSTSAARRVHTSSKSSPVLSALRSAVSRARALPAIRINAVPGVTRWPSCPSISIVHRRVNVRVRRPNSELALPRGSGSGSDTLLRRIINDAPIAARGNLGPIATCATGDAGKNRGDVAWGGSQITFSRATDWRTPRPDRRDQKMRGGRGGAPNLTIALGSRPPWHHFRYARTSAPTDPVLPD